MKTLHDYSEELRALKGIVKFLENKIDRITEKEFGAMVDKFWLEWACREKLSPCGHLTIAGKREFLKDNREAILKIFEEQDG